MDFQQRLVRVATYIDSPDPISRDGVAAQLRPHPEVLVLPEEERDRAQVAVVVADAVDEPVRRCLRTHQVSGLPVVLVVAVVEMTGLVAAVEAGIIALLRRGDASAERLIPAISAAAAGEGSLPTDLLGPLLQQLGALHRTLLGPQRLSLNGFTERELEVLRLAADGYDTVEIAHKLNYSDRTIKNVFYDIRSRFHLRNRAHAVAYALRNGLI
ncbi:LuxR C-terminal-related transcriptional regulator [Micromonospora sp. NPDC049559]|uniref:helix-turn-helix transcriptional regulator n=1 Tax=Micromonospora sp. NPDC049559 TaxID=3155923 RepID=UPI00343A6949